MPPLKKDSNYKVEYLLLLIEMMKYFHKRFIKMRPVEVKERHAVTSSKRLNKTSNKYLNEFLEQKSH